MTEKERGPILLVGAGKMGSALLKGWFSRGIGKDRIIVQEPEPAPEVEAFLKSTGLDEGIVEETPSVIVLAVKPQMMDDVAAKIAPLAGANTVIMSVAAGCTVTQLAAHFSDQAAIIRVMPNTPAAIERGISALYASPAVTDDQRDDCDQLMKAVGETVWLDTEAQMDAVTAVSGSGPAYVFLLAELLAKAGETAGLPVELAARLARQTVAGAGELMYQSQDTPAQLRKNVTSPAGTTEAALKVLMGPEMDAEDGPLADILRDAVLAATQRSRELAG